MTVVASGEAMSGRAHTGRLSSPVAMVAIAALILCGACTVPWSRHQPSESNASGNAVTWKLPAAPACGTAVAWPARVTISAPDPSLDPKLAGFLGVWEGDWGSSKARLAFDMIDPVQVAGVFASPQSGASPAQSFRFTAQISADAIISAAIADGPIARSAVQRGPAFDVTLSDRGRSLTGAKVESGISAPVKMHRCTAPSTSLAAPGQGSAATTESAGLPVLPAVATATDAGAVDGKSLIETRAAVETRTLGSPVIGSLYLPTQQSGPLPGVLVLHGSEGYDAGASESLAKHLAAQGFLTLALCYFGCDGRPGNLQRISLEYVLSSMQYLQSLPDVQPDRVSVLGLSRGAELALLVGVNGQNVRSVVSYYGSPYVYSALAGSTVVRDCAWLLRAECLAPGAKIPVQDIRAPVLLLAGLDDELWPLSYSQTIADTLEAAGRPYAITLFPGVGHAFGIPRCIIGVDSCTPISDRSIGGWNREAYVSASRLAFAQVVAFLKDG